MNARTLGLGAVFVVAAIAGGGWWLHGRGSVATVRVGGGRVHERLVARAAVTPVDGIAEIRARVEGQVVRVHVREGDTVAAGALLAEMDNVALREELTRREAELESLQSSLAGIREGARPQERTAAAAARNAAQRELDLASDRLSRTEVLHAGGTATEQAVVEARQAVEVARARLDVEGARLALAQAGGRPSDVSAAQERLRAARSAVAQAREMQGYLRIVAPVAGTVLARRVDPGDTVSLTAGAPVVFEMADAARLEIRAEVEESDAARVAAGQSVDVTLPGGVAHLGRGTIARVGQRLERRTIGADDARVRAEGLVRAVWIDARADDGAAGSWAIGQRLEVVVEVAPVGSPTVVPRAALRIHEGRATVAQPGLFGAREIPVRVGAADTDRVAVEGVAPGTEILAVR